MVTVSDAFVMVALLVVLLSMATKVSSNSKFASLIIVTVTVCEADEPPGNVTVVCPPVRL